MAPTLSLTQWMQELEWSILNTAENEIPLTYIGLGMFGVGKSASTKQAFKKHGFEIFPLSLGRLEAYDIKGMPNFLTLKDKIKEVITMQWAPPKFWLDVAAAGSKAVVIFDEVTHASPAVQAAVLDVIYEHKMDDIDLSQARVVCLGNYGGDDGTFAGTLSTAFMNRCATFNIRQPEIEQWMDYVEPPKWIKTFFEVQGADSVFYVRAAADETFGQHSTPRSWELYINGVCKKLNMENDTDKRRACLYARALLNEVTAEQIENFLLADQISPAKLLRLEAAEWSKFKKHDEPTMRSVVLKDLVGLMFPMTYAKTTAQREELKPKMTKVVQKVIDTCSHAIQGYKAAPNTVPFTLDEAGTAFLSLAGTRDSQLFMSITFEYDKKDYPVTIILDQIYRATFAGKKK